MGNLKPICRIKLQGWIQGGPGGPGPPLTTKNEAPHQNSTKLRPQNGSFRPVTIWAPPPPDQILDPPLSFIVISLTFTSTHKDFQRVTPAGHNCFIFTYIVAKNRLGQRLVLPKRGNCGFARGTHYDSDTK